MAGLPAISLKDARTIKVITKKLRLNASKIGQLQAASKANIPADQAIANLLGIAPGEDPKEFIAKRLTPAEFEVLRRFLGNAIDGNPLD